MLDNLSSLQSPIYTDTSENQITRTDPNHLKKGRESEEEEGSQRLLVDETTPTKLCSK